VVRTSYLLNTTYYFVIVIILLLLLSLSLSLLLLLLTTKSPVVTLCSPDLTVKNPRFCTRSVVYYVFGMILETERDYFSAQN